MLLIRFYQRVLSPLLGPCGRFEPSCSRYTHECLRLHGAAKEDIWVFAALFAANLHLAVRPTAPPRRHTLPLLPSPLRPPPPDDPLIPDPWPCPLIPRPPRRPRARPPPTNLAPADPVLNWFAKRFPRKKRSSWNAAILSLLLIAAVLFSSGSARTSLAVNSGAAADRTGQETAPSSRPRARRRRSAIYGVTVFTRS